MAYLVEMQEVSKAYPGLVANEGVTLQVAAGEVHAILGDSGAGKSTLLSILAGLLPLDSGTIAIAGKPVQISSPRSAITHGIGIVHQQPHLVPHFTVAQQLMLGNEGGPLPSSKEASAQTERLTKRYGFSLTPEMEVGTLSHIHQQRVAILQLLYRDTQILLFDNPTAGLTPDERAELFAHFRLLAKEGRACVFTSRSPSEVVEIADTATVLRAGKLVERIAVDTKSTPVLAALMGRTVEEETRVRKATPSGQVLLEVRDLRVRADSTLAINEVTLTVRSGEILALAGAEGHGQIALTEAIVGLRPIESGTIIVDGNDISYATTKRRSELGLGFLPADRAAQALMLNRTIADNLALKAYRRPPNSRRGILNRSAMHQYAQKVADEYGFSEAIDLNARAKALLPAEQVQVILAREMHQSKLLIAVEPVQGVDNKTALLIRKHLMEYRDRGNAVLLVTAQLEEWLHLADRIAVLHTGELVNIVEASESNRDRIERMMRGIRGRSEG